MNDDEKKTNYQKDAWHEALRQKQTYGKFPAQSCRTNPGSTQAHNKAAGRKGGIRRQGSKRG